MKLFYSPSFTGECYRNLPVNQAFFEKVVGDAGLLDFLQLKLGLTGQYDADIERILAYQAAMETSKQDAFYEKAFAKDPLATAKEILRWRDLLVMEGFEASAGYKSLRLRKLAEVESTFSEAGLIGTPEKWKQVLKFSRHKGKLPGMEIEVCYNFCLLPKLIRESLKALGVTKGRYDWSEGQTEDPVWDPKNKDITIYYFDTVADAYFWAAKSRKDYDGVVICPDPFRMNAVFRNQGQPLLNASASGDSPVLQILRLGLSLLDRPLDIKNLLEYLRASYSPIPDKHRFALAKALLREGGRGEKWKEALSECKEDPNVNAFLLALINTNVENGMVAKEVVSNWCGKMKTWSETFVSKEAIAYQLELNSLCDGLCRVIHNMVSDKIEVKSVMKTLKTLYEPSPVQTDQAMANSWNTVGNHRCLIDVPEKLLWVPGNGGLETAYPYTFLLQEEIDELQVPKMSDCARHDFNLMVDRLGKVQTIELCTCDFDCMDALVEHPAVTLCKPAAKEEDLHTSGSSSASIFKPLLTIKTGVDLFPRRRDENENETTEDYVLSASSIETLVAYPFDFVMEKKLEFQDVSSLQLANLNLTQGTVAHFVFQKMLEDGGGSIRAMKDMLEEITFGKLVDKAAEERGAVLLLKENRTLFIHFKETIRKSIGVLLDILEISGLKPMYSEEALDVTLDFSEITGSVDFHAETKTGEIVVIDFKYSNGKSYIEKLDENKAIQLEIYAESLKKKWNKDVVAKAYYFFPISQLHTDDESGVFPKNKAIFKHKKTDNDTPLLKRIMNSVEFRKTQLMAGYLEMAEGAPLEEIDYHLSVEEKKLIDIPATGKKDNRVKAFYIPTKFPILKDSIQ